MNSAVSISNVRKSFGSKVAVDDLNLEIPSGSLCGFIGPNGAGKTTTIRMVMSIIFPDRGDIRVLGKASAMESKDRIGYLPEERGVYRKMKVAPFLRYIARLKGVDGPAAAKRSADWLERVGLAESAGRRCEELSKGMQQKVQFIASVIHEPELLILDEVFSGLDPVNRKLMRELIDEQHRAGRTIIFSTHAMYEAEQLCDRIFMIHHGKKVIDAPLAEIRRRFDSRTVIVEPVGPFDAAMDALASLSGVTGVEAHRDGLHLAVAPSAQPGNVLADAVSVLNDPPHNGTRRVERKRITLEEVFIDLVEARGEVLDEKDRAEIAEIGAGAEARS
ncbi:MAG: ATP-binding cassette domain-containing protein [Phycisphaeraceae bacterium]|nr:ATP-binding cassette domain-containing protein [Phycisphaeraceae bacterium]